MRTIVQAAICVSVFITLLISTVKAQENVSKFQFGLAVGAMVYQGDLTPEAAGSYRTLKPAVNLFAGKIFNSFLSGRVNLAIGKLRGNDAAYDKPEYRQQRNFNFVSPVTELSIIAEWNPLGRNYRTRSFYPYVFAGAGYSFLEIRRDWSRLNSTYFSTESGVLTGLPEDVAHDPPSGLLVFPVGVGARYFFNDRLGVNAESAYRLADTDYLDGFSQSANPQRTDHYYSHSVGVVYRVGKKNTLACPVVRY